MRAIIDATGYQPEMEMITKQRPTPLLKIADKPILIRIIECLANRQVKQFDLILNHLPDVIEEQIGDGKRWGVKIEYHLVKDYRRPFSSIANIVRNSPADTFILAKGDLLPLQQDVLFNLQDPEAPVIMLQGGKTWSGWGIFSSAMLAHIPPQLSDKEFLNTIQAHYRAVPAYPYLSTQSLQELKKSNMRLLNQEERQQFPSSAKMVEPGIWLSRSVGLHKDVCINPPVFIGENCQIKEGARIGPYTVIETNCIIDNYSLVENSLVCENSYVGDSLEIKNSIVDRNLLFNLNLDAFVAVQDEFILGELKAPQIKSGLHHFGERALALLLATLMAPCFALMSLTHQIQGQAKLVLPVAREGNWKSFALLSYVPRGSWQGWSFHRRLKNLPALLNIIRGEVHFVGVAPRSVEEVRTLTKEWQNLYLRSKAGLITLCKLDYQGYCTPDEQYASEAFYIVQSSPAYDWKLFIRWLKQFFKKRKPDGKKA